MTTPWSGSTPAAGRRARRSPTPPHQRISHDLRHAYNQRARHTPTTRAHDDGHVVAIRALPDYDALFGVDFHTHQGAS